MTMSAFIMRGMGRWFGVGLQMLCVVVALTSAELCVAEPMTLSEAQATVTINGKTQRLSLIHISEPTRPY